MKGEMFNKMGPVFYSIIVPIYNVEQYLPAAIESVLKQSFTDYEIILVDDGSPDNCPAICDQYAAKYKQIRVIHKPNGGLSDARNTGMKSAKGEYIVFLDSDDLMNDDVLSKIERIIMNANKPELVIGNMLNKLGDRIWCKREFDPNEIDKTTIYSLIQSFVKKYNYIPWAAYQSVYRKDFLEKNNFFFDKEIVGAEDCDFFMRLSTKIKKIVLTDINLVIYRMGREGSIITSPKFSGVYGQLIIFSRWFNYCTKLGYTTVAEYFADCFANTVVLISYLTSKERRICKDLIIENKHIFKYTSTTPKYKVAKAVWKLMGFYHGSNLLRKLRNKK